jgi:hypothetical protein
MIAAEIGMPSVGMQAVPESGPGGGCYRVCPDPHYAQGLLGTRESQSGHLWKASLVRGVVLHSGKSRPLDADDIALPWGWMVPEPR